MYPNLRQYLSEYWKRRLLRNDVLHIDVFAYEYLAGSIVFEYRLSAGGRKVLRSLFFHSPGLLAAEPPKQIPANSTALVDITLSEPIRVNAKGRSVVFAQFWRNYHHRFMRDLAVEYPLSDEFKRRSIRFWYFVNPDHDPVQGFSNWYVNARKARTEHARPMP